MKPISGMLVCIWTCAALSPAFAVEGEDMPRTVVESDALVMNATAEQNLFYFTGNVRVTGTNLVVTCERLEVVTTRKGDDTEAVIGELTAIESIVATGRVKIFQAGRLITAGRAVLNPREGRVVLTDHPKIIDREVEVSGWRIILLKGERKALVEANPEQGQGGRPTVKLDSLPDLGYREKEPEKAGSTNGEAALPPDEERAREQ